MNNMALYLLGFAIVIAGLAWGAISLGIATQWVAIGAVILAGFGILSGVSKTRLKESSPDDESKKVVIQDND